MSTVEIENIGSKISVARAAANTAATAGGSGDNTAVTGVIIDRAALGWPQSAVFAVPFTTTLGATNTLSVAMTVQDGDNSGLSDAGTFATRANGVVATGPGGGGTVTGVVELDVNLSGAKRYVRLNFTPDLSAANTDTAALSAVAVLGGATRLPA
ncbi:hypothetical protein [Sandarakinorhabdus sp.]|uniref:hypothetical protein n=1 Tax=Sandarakinorhabdus sp. TaxID=1916663 RepID=UPI0028AA507D|nr:hypothetical protein [Sandarakinorhabdus sp.]